MNSRTSSRMPYQVKRALHGAHAVAYVACADDCVRCARKSAPVVSAIDLALDGKQLTDAGARMGRLYRDGRILRGHLSGAKSRSKKLCRASAPVANVGAAPLRSLVRNGSSFPERIPRPILPLIEATYRGENADAALLGAKNFDAE